MATAPPAQAQAQAQAHAQAQAQNGQQQPKATPGSTSPLDNLQAMVNLVLIQSGRFLKEQQAGGGTGRNHYSMKRAIPAALDRFQDSLDELENELQQAQAVLRRDLALLQADRLKREQAEAAERQRLAAESSAKKNLVPHKEEPAPAVSPPVVKTEESTVDAKPSELEVQPPVSDKAEPPPPISTSDAPPTERDPLFDGTPTTANAQDTDFDFDAMFGDSINDVEAGAADNQGDVDMDAPAPDLNFNLDDSAPSLLRGLEDFAKGGDDNPADPAGGSMDIDFAMPDLPDLPTEQPPAQASATKPEEPPEKPQPTDTFGDDEVNLETMATDDLDDLFNMDYENPENTEFDNAFFGFDDN